MDNYVQKLEETNQKLEQELSQVKELLKTEGPWHHKEAKTRLFAWKPKGYPVPTDIQWKEAIQVRINLSFYYRTPWPTHKHPEHPWKQRWTYLKFWFFHWGGGSSMHCNVEAHSFYLCVLGVEVHLSPWITSPANFDHDGAILANGIVCQSKN